MTPDALMRDYEDLSTDAGFQFRFHCPRCDAAYVSRFQPCVQEVGEVLLAPVGELLAEVQHETSEEQIAEGAPEHESALRVAAPEASEHFHECPRCGEWVCDECWNSAILQCEKCAPSEADEHEAAVGASGDPPAR